MESDEELLTPPEVTELAKNIEVNLLPTKSRKLYNQIYTRFMNYRHGNNIKSFSENVMLVYFAELSKKMKSSTLWSIYSMLKATLNVHNNIDISKFLKLRVFLKRQSHGYRPKKSRVLEREQIEKFLLEAPDDTYLTTKVVLIFGVAGACRCDELVQMKIDDIEDMSNKLLIAIPDNKTKKPRSFVVTEHLDIYRKYVASRPLDLDIRRFFYNYSRGKASKQLVGIHKFGRMAKEIATYLKLSNANEYTGHCFRRTSATLLVNSGANITLLKRHGGWKSSTVAEGYIEDSIANKVFIGERIFPKFPEEESSANLNGGSSTINSSAKETDGDSIANKLFSGERIFPKISSREQESTVNLNVGNSTINSSAKKTDGENVITIQNCSNISFNIYNK